jgi:hypothetical protein
MNFGEALEALKNGTRVSRSGWNGKDMWLRLIQIEESIGDDGVQPWEFSRHVRTPSQVRFYAVPGVFTCLPWIGMKTADGGFVPWVASQTDLLAEDWGVVD